jgi:O-antigen ligase/tetratricopeptide (TPR) repeat protein
MPLALGGANAETQTAAAAVAAALLGLWLYKAVSLGKAAGSRGAGALGALMAFSVLVTFQTVPLPPWLLAEVSPRAHALFTEVLPGWPEAGGWMVWRPLALEPFAAQVGLLEFSVAFAVFAILAGYPWGRGAADLKARRLVFGRLVATLLASGFLVAALALVQRSVGASYLLPASAYLGSRGIRAHGPYANPNHLAGYLEMLIPLGLLYVAVLARGLWKLLAARTDAAKRIALSLYRTWVAALVGMQQRLIAPLVGLAGLGVMLLAHRATGSRGGLASLGVAGIICAVAFLRRAASAPERARLRRLGTAALLAVALAAVMGGQFVLSSADDATAAGPIESHLRARLIAIQQGSPLLLEFPLFGVGLGSWGHAFRLYQAPPIERVDFTYAHNDYLQLAVETGLLGTLVLVCFAWAVLRAARGLPSLLPAENDSRRDLVVASGRRRAVDAGQEADGDWWSAFRQWELLRIGLAAGVGALVVHGLSDFNLRIPANALIFMTLLGLLVLSAPVGAHRLRRSAWAPVTLLVVIAFATAGPVLRLAPFSVDGSVSARTQLDAAGAPEVLRQQAVAHARRAVELAPLAPEVHEVCGRTLADPAAGDTAYRRAIRLSPDATRVRDVLALRLWDRGERATALQEFEESMAHAPRLAFHHYLAPGTGLDPTTPRDRIAALAAGDSLPARLRLLDPAIRQAIEQGLRRGLAGGEYVQRAKVVADLATLLEVNERYAEAGAVLEAWAAGSPTDGRFLRHAASQYLKAGDFVAAERVLTEQLAHTPDDGELYRLLAVEVYAVQRDFDAADLVLTAGRQNSAHLLPIYRGIREILTLRQYHERRAQMRRVVGAEVSRVDGSVDRGAVREPVQGDW